MELHARGAGATHAPPSLCVEHMLARAQGGHYSRLTSPLPQPPEEDTQLILFVLMNGGRSNA